MKKILLGMSGGVDSSAAALLLKQKGFDVTGIYLKMFPRESLVRPSLYVDGAEAAALAAQKIGIDFLSLDVSDTFKKKVVDNFCESYISGATPNPCVVCNVKIKFGVLLDFALQNGFDYVATGHYAEIKYQNGRFLLRRPENNPKEQTYVLWGLDQHRLSHAMFPLASKTKKEIREIARLAGLDSWQKPDSQDICFVPDGNYAAFINNFHPDSVFDGYFVDLCGNRISKHNGFVKYTIGQRRGLGISFGEPHYVISKNPADYSVTLGRETLLFSSCFCVEKLNWIMYENPPNEFDAFVKIRYNQEQLPCRIRLFDDFCEVVVSRPIRAVAKGQSAVFYSEKDYVIGGGIIRG